MQIEHIIFLIHPCCYESLTHAEVARDNLQFYVELERKVKTRWLGVLAERPQSTLMVQLGGPEDLSDQAIAHLGVAMVFYPRTKFPTDGDLDEYYRRLAADFNAHLSNYHLQLDLQTATSELWGESFEGCVPGYGGAFAEYLGLQQAPRMRFEMTVYDSRFLHGVVRHEVIPLIGSDIEAWLFQCGDGTAAAIFQARRTAQWIDERRVHIALDDRRIQVCTKLGHTLWPEAPWEKGKTETVQLYSMALKDCIWRWVRSVGMPYERFRAVIGAARITK